MSFAAKQVRERLLPSLTAAQLSISLFFHYFEIPLIAFIFSLFSLIFAFHELLLSLAFAIFHFLPFHEPCFCADYFITPRCDA